jgi:hypothetical protein
MQREMYPETSARQMSGSPVTHPTKRLTLCRWPCRHAKHVQNEEIRYKAAVYFAEVSEWSHWQL